MLERSSILAFSQDRDLRYTWVYCPHLPDALEAVRGRTDGELAHVDALAPLRSPEKSTVIREGRTMRQEVVLETPRGTMVWDLAICPYPDARGEITGLVGVAVDVTERRLLQEKEWQAERLEAAGRLAGGIAHQFNNRLTSILTNVHLLQDDLPEGDPNRDDLRAIEQAVTYLGDLTQQLHAFSGRLPLRRESLDLNQLLEGMRDRIDRLRGDRIGIAVRLEPSLWPVMGDPVRLEEAVLTLVQRGCASMPAGGTLALETRNEARSPGAAVALEVRDSGVAVSAEAIDRMFEPFSEPAAVVSDPDLRLAGCHGVIRRHGGTLDVRVSQAGSVFTLRLPRAAAPARAAATSRRTPVPAGQETILLAEDERELSNVLTRLLRRAGYQVIAVPNGEEALVQLEEHGTGIDLLVSDIVMPGMLGTELARQARTRFPDLPILLTSGYGETEDLPEVDFLEKPFLPNVFLEWVRATLRQPA